MVLVPPLFPPPPRSRSVQHSQSTRCLPIYPPTDRDNPTQHYQVPVATVPCQVLVQSTPLPLSTPAAGSSQVNQPPDRSQRPPAVIPVSAPLLALVSVAGMTRSWRRYLQGFQCRERERHQYMNLRHQCMSLQIPHCPMLNPGGASDQGNNDDVDADIDADLDAPAPYPPIWVSEDLPISPSKDFRSYADLICKMAVGLGISTSQPAPVEDDIIFDMVQAAASSVLAIPLSKVMLQSAKSCCDKLALIPLSSKCLDHLYRTQEDLAEFLFKHPQPNSVVVSSFSKSHCHHSTSSDKKGRKLDSCGRCLYSTRALGIKSCNYIACMSCYIHAIF